MLCTAFYLAAGLPVPSEMQLETVQPGDSEIKTLGITVSAIRLEPDGLELFRDISGEGKGCLGFGRARRGRRLVGREICGFTPLRLFLSQRPLACRSRKERDPAEGCAEPTALTIR